MILEFAVARVVRERVIWQRALASTLIACFSLSASAQSPMRSSNADTATRGRDFTASSPAAHKDLFRPRDLAVAVGVSAIVVGLMPLDRSIERVFQREGLKSDKSLSRAADGFTALGDPGSIAFSAVTYFSGLATHSRKVASLGMHTGEAIVLGGVIAEALKGSFGRQRPRVDTTQPHVFHPGKGFSNDDFASFPSGDVTLAFAAATAASREVAHSWPGAARYVALAAYGSATMVAVSRLYQNEHWASDVVAGAAVGTLAGTLFDRYNVARPDNVFNRIFLPASLVLQRNRIAVAWSM